MSGDTFGKSADLLRNELLHRFILRGKTLHKVLADSVSLRFRQDTLNILALHLSIFQFQGHIYIRQNNPIAGRIDNQHRVSGNIHHLLTFAGMIVPHQYDIESRHILRYVERSVLVVFARHFESLLSGMEQADHQIRVLFFTDNLHPFACRLFHIIETQSFPQIFREPCRDGRGNHSQYHDLHALTFQHFVRSQMGLSRRCIYDVGTQHWEVTSGDPTVENGTSRFHVMVTHVAGIILHIIHHFRAKMGRHRIYIIIVIGSGLSLQNIAVIQQYQILLILFALFLHERINPCETPLPFVAGYKIIRIIIAMYITCFYNLQFHHLFLRRNRQSEAEKQAIN